jgi:ATP-dependent DNA helicase DinG
VSLRELLGEGGALSRTLRVYESRPEQLAMAHAVEEALGAGTPLLVEAGTGTGKSLAYLVPAARSGLRVVISTATKTLGEQLIERDIPTLRRLGLDPDVALVKGLSNYVCLRRLEEHRRAVVTGAARTDHALAAVLRWVEETETGDRAELSDVPDDAPVWRDVVSSSDTRVGAKCRHYERCFVTRMRRRAEGAQIIVTNHHLFCADLALRGAGLGAQALPDYDAVIFDEAHALEEVATEFFGVRITRARVDTLLRDAARAFETTGFFVDPSRAQSIGRTLAGISGAAAALFAALPRAHGGGDMGGSGRVLLGKGGLDAPLADAVRALDQGLQHLGEHVRDFVGDSDVLLAIARRTASLREALAMATDTTSPNHVAYCEAEARGGGALGASPIEVGPILRDKLWARRGAVVLTSATLSTAGEAGFAFVRRRLGVPADARELVLASPFDYGAQAALYVPRRLPEPRDLGYFAAAVDEIRRLVDITEGGAFVLCTSVRQMRAFAAELRGTWRYPTWVQGEAPKQALLARFRAAGNGVLVATSSFWEGVDVPGRALRLVIIDKLPFEAPNDPVVAARIQRMTEQGHEPFDDYQVPVAALALKQGFGRLIRTRRDAGIVAILDRRLVSRGYGKRLLAALPPASRCATLDELRAFWHSVRDEQPRPPLATS